MACGCSFAPAPVAEVGEGPPAKFQVSDAKGSDAAALADAGSKTDAATQDGPRTDSSDSSGPGADAADAATAETAAADALEDGGEPEVVDPQDADSPDGTDPDGGSDAAAGDADAGSADVAPAPGFGAVWTKVLAKFGCSAALCHGLNAAQPIFPNQGIAYAVLLQEAGSAGDCSGVPLVTVGKPEQSLLWLKIAPDTPSCGMKMPITAENNGLDSASAALVAAWIKGGAKP